jgi:imidazolonepropionase-like amidohydrolase
MNTWQRRFAFALVLMVVHLAVYAHQEIPGEKQKKPVALTNARLYTIANGVMDSATIVFDKGVITAVGRNVAIPAGADVRDLKGKSVYPSFIAPYTTLGLTEIDAARPTRDMSESGSFNPNARAEIAYNPDSELLPTVRSNGMLIVNSVPQGGVVSGTSALMMLDGWTKEDCALKLHSALAVDFPSMSTYSAPGMSRTPDQQRSDIEKNVKQLYDYFTKARMYSLAARNGLADNDRDIRMEAMRPVFESNLPVMISCSEMKQILGAIDFAKQFQLRAILVGCQDAAYCLKEIRASGYPVIVARIHGLPMRENEGYDKTYVLPKQLQEAGIMFAFSDNGSWQQRNLAFNAGSAVAFGLPEAEALKGLTLWPARMFGVDAKVGSLEIGKEATLFVSTGNALDGRTNNLEMAFVQGRAISLQNRHTRLAEKYRTKFRRQK